VSKVSIIGAGFVGSTIAHWAMVAGGFRVVLVDIVEGLARGKVLDLIQSGPIAACSGCRRRMTSPCRGSSIVIVTGVARSRDDPETRVQTNAKIVSP
jgi:malate dehydrogenase